MARVTKPESPRAKKKKRAEPILKRVSQLEIRMDQLESAVVSRLAQFEQNVISQLSRFGDAEYQGRNVFRVSMIGIGLLLAAILLARMYGKIGI